MDTYKYIHDRVTLPNSKHSKTRPKHVKNTSKHIQNMSKSFQTRPNTSTVQDSHFDRSDKPGRNNV